MQIKRYEVNNLQEGMAKIRKELGPDAIILSTKMLAGSKLMEITAARDAGSNSVQQQTPHKKNARTDDDFQNLRTEIGEIKSSIDILTQKVFQQRNMLDETMGVLVDRIMSGCKDHLSEIYHRLIFCGISRNKAAGLIEIIRQEFPAESCNTYLKGARVTERLIARSLTKDDRKGSRIKAFIGPTGVGKTTTLAKLAARYSLDRKMKVGLITTDTYRIAAAEQLKVYAKIMSLPLEVASEKESLARSLEKYSDKDMILIDTPGRSQYDERSLQALKDILTPAVETVLLVSPACRKEALFDTVEHYSLFDFGRIILTKVDECRQLGPLFDVLSELKKPVSYLTTGQNVPKDIERTSPERLARMMFQN